MSALYRALAPHAAMFILSTSAPVGAENGPYRINENLTLAVNEHGWDNGHNVIFVDQPIGTGFSYSDSPKDVVYTEKGVPAQGLPMTVSLCASPWPVNGTTSDPAMSQ